MLINIIFPYYRYSINYYFFFFCSFAIQLDSADEQAAAIRRELDGRMQNVLESEKVRIPSILNLINAIIISADRNFKIKTRNFFLKKKQENTWFNSGIFYEISTDISIFSVQRKKEHLAGAGELYN